MADPAGGAPPADAQPTTPRIEQPTGDRNIYTADGLPVLKRTWFWLLAGLLILASGIVIGLALSRLLAPVPVVERVQSAPSQDYAKLALLETDKRRLIRRLAELETIANRDVCSLDRAMIEAPDGVAGTVAGTAPIGRIIEDPSQTAAPSVREASLSPSPQGPRSGPAAEGERAARPASEPGTTQPGPDPAAPASTSPPAEGTDAAQGSPSDGTPQTDNAPETARFGDVLGPATFLVIVNAGGAISIGSAFLIDPSHAVTNAHVVGDQGARIVIQNDASGGEVPVTVVAKQHEEGIGGSDFALLKLARTPAGVRPLKLTAKADKAQEVVAAGYPGEDVKRLVSLGGNIDSTFTRGAIRVIEHYQGHHPVINHDADIRKGNSGGPLVDKCGRVVGVNTYGLGNLKFSLKTDGLLAFLKPIGGLGYTVSNGECTF